MKNNISRILIETIVRRTLHDIKDSPERSTRNLIDMALHFSEGRFQRHFFAAAQEMLRNEHSAYYALIQDTVASVDTERILTFGMNLGYNSCTVGAETIRSIERKENFNIPWSLALELDASAFSSLESVYHSVLSQGKALGIYTWLLFTDHAAAAVLPLVQAHPDCAFVLFCPAGEITDALLDDADALRNLMFAVRAGDGAGKACALLRSRSFLYSLAVLYGSENADAIADGDLLAEAETLHPVFTFFLAEPACPVPTQERVYNSILDARRQQLYRTALFDLSSDNRLVDAIISNDACGAAFDRRGNLSLRQSSRTEAEYNLFQNPLADIFRRAFPKGN